MGISRGPVREAFRALEQAGLVHTEKNRGVFVRQVSLEEAHEIYEVRAALEAQIGRLAAARITAEQLDRLRGIVKRMHAVGRSRDPDAYFPLNLEFHETLAEACGNRALATNYRRVVNELNLYRRQAIMRNVEIIPVSTKEHEAIVEAVGRRDAAAAERLLYAHVLDSRARLHAKERVAA
jgi:DNA-binding GntR family transcriptional regulator